jgi:hypothetical protein
MNKFKVIFAFESKKTLSKINITLFALFFLILLYLVQNSLTSHKALLKDKDVFFKTEKSRPKKYQRYSQYGGDGIRLMLVPSHASILFDDTVPFNEILSKINTGDILNIYYRLKGKNFFFETSGLDIAGIFFIFGAFFGMLSGYFPFRKPDYLKFVSSASNFKRAFLFVLLSKFIILSLSFLLLLCGVLLWSYLNSFNIINLNLLYVVLAFISILGYFLSIGALLGAIKKRSSVIAFGGIFVIMTFFVPLISNKIVYVDASELESLFNFELENLKIIMAVEKRFDKQFGTIVEGKDNPPDEYKKKAKEAINKEFNLLRQRENRLKQNILKKIMRHQMLKSFFPVTFWDSIKKEMSSKGGKSFIDFYSFSQTRKDEFLIFFVEKRFSKLDKGKPFRVESFIKKDENIYHAKSHLPFNFGLGLGVTVLFTIGFLLIAYGLHSKRLKIKSREIDFSVNFEQGKNTVFVLCKNEAIKRDILNHYKQKDAACIDKINPADFKFNGIKPADLLNHLSRVAGVDEKRARENLGIMGVDIDTVKVKAGKARQKLGFFGVDIDASEKEKANELILKIYMAVMAAMDRQLIVINDFFKRESRQCEGDCFKLLSNLIAAGKKIIYLSTEMYQTTENLDEKIKAKINNYGVWHIEDKDLIQITLR